SSEAGETRRAAARVVNNRPGCRAFVTRKRSLENYLHPEAVRECRGLSVSWDDDESVPEHIARHLFEARGPGREWDSLSYRARRRLRDRAKRWLNTEAVDRMTPERLREGDPGGEILSWLRSLDELLQPSG